MEEAAAHLDRRDSTLASRREVAADTGITASSLIGSEIAANFLLRFGHSQVLLGPVVGKGDSTVIDKALVSALMHSQTSEEVLDLGLLETPPLAGGALTMGGVEGPSLVHEGGLDCMDRPGGCGEGVRTRLGAVVASRHTEGVEEEE